MFPSHPTPRLKTGDTALAMDVLPIMNKNISTSEDDAYHGQKPSLAACLELLPVLKEMVESRYETYQITALQSIYAILNCWQKDFKVSGYSLRRMAALLLSTSVSMLTHFIPLFFCTHALFLFFNRSDSNRLDPPHSRRRADVRALSAHRGLRSAVLPCTRRFKR